jgi:hypothetical protein
LTLYLPNLRFPRNVVRLLAFRSRLPSLDLCLLSPILKTIDFFIRQIAKGPFRKIAERHGADPDPFQPDHRTSHTVEHAPYLAFPSFVDRDLDPGVGLFLPDLLYFCGSSLAVIEINAFLEVVYLAVF